MNSLERLIFTKFLLIGVYSVVKPLKCKQNLTERLFFGDISLKCVTACLDLWL